MEKQNNIVYKIRCGDCPATYIGIMKLILASAWLLRLIFIIYGTFHDKKLEVKFTDIDYSVFTEAAGYVTKGESPYSKDTYKYTPFLAILLTPNIYLHPLFGKVLFCVVDLVAAVILYRLLQKNSRCSEAVSQLLVCACWLFNPFTITISSRGNAESVQVFLVLSSLAFVLNNQLMLAGILYGVSVHFKLYPIIYALPILIFIGRRRSKYLGKMNTLYNTIESLFSLFVNKDNIVFGAASSLSFCVLGFAMYQCYGMEFIDNTYLFHLHRKDLQHNFSPFFYILRQFQSSKWMNIVNRMAFLPQFASVVWLGVKYHENLALACFLQTFAFVTFNKVCTSQYFIWYISLFPLAYPYFKISVRRLSQLVAAWLGAQAVWLMLAYLLEFKKYDIAFYVWLASLLFLCVNIWILREFVTHIGDDGRPTDSRYDVKKRKPLKSS